MQTIGVISDTHRSLPDKALAVFLGEYRRSQVVNHVDFVQNTSVAPSKVDLIIHAGDIGELEPLSQNIIDRLEAIAPVAAVLGNRDIKGYVAGGTLVSEQLHTVDFNGLLIAVMHKPEDLNAAVKSLKQHPDVMVHGHKHIPKLQQQGQRLFMCPGSIHNPKGEWPMRTVGLIHVDEGRLASAEIVKL